MYRTPSLTVPGTLNEAGAFKTCRHDAHLRTRAISSVCRLSTANPLTLGHNRGTPLRCLSCSFRIRQSVSIDRLFLSCNIFPEPSIVELEKESLKINALQLALKNGAFLAPKTIKPEETMRYTENALVIHRVGGLEEYGARIRQKPEVIHRVGGLEDTDRGSQTHFCVIHRVGGLEVEK